jgi:hypothetical protein
MKPVIQRFILGYLGVTSVAVGAWAQFAPRSFYDDFPGFGRMWVRVDGPFNEHLVRDVGGLNLALAAVLVGAMISLRRPMVVVAAIAALLYGIPHFIYHVSNRVGLSGPDVAASLGGLAMFAVLPGLLLLPKGVESDRNEE